MRMPDATIRNVLLKRGLVIREVTTDEAVGLVHVLALCDSDQRGEWIVRQILLSGATKMSNPVQYYPYIENNEFTGHYWFSFLPKE